MELQILDVILGVLFVYLLLSLICTSANEMAAGIFSLRAKSLQKGLRTLLQNSGQEGLEDRFYAHPLIKNLCNEKGRKPSYIPSRTFTMALLDTITPANAADRFSAQSVRKALESLPADSDLRRSLLLFLDEAQDDVALLRENVETWFDNTMDRVSGWYKRQSQKIVLCFAAVFTILANADTISIARTLSTDSVLRESLAAQVVNYTEQETPTASQETLQNAMRDLKGSGLPLGWSAQNRPTDAAGWLNKILGLLVTIFAVSMGAPFWFDILGRVVRIRSGGVLPGGTNKKSSKT